MSTPRTVLTRESGPLLVGRDTRRFWELTLSLATTEFKLAYFGSTLGYLWSLMRPLLLFGVLYVMFTEVVKVGNQVPHYPVYLLMSIVLWTFFAEATSGCVRSMLNREAMLRKMRFPRLVIPLSVSLTALFNLGTNFIAVLVFAIGSGVYPRWSWLEMPFLVLLLVALATGIGLILAPLYVRFRDIEPIWTVLLQIGFYASPILYVASFWPNSIERILLVNPIASILTQMRHVFIDPSAPNLATAFGATWRILLPLLIIALIVATGMAVFRREAPRVAEEL